jgi:hypothetical protein
VRPTHPPVPPNPPARSPASFGNSFGAADTSSPGGGASSRDPYAWAQRLRDIPDEDVLAELSMMGYTDGVGGRRSAGTRRCGRGHQPRRPHARPCILFRERRWAGWLEGAQPVLSVGGSATSAPLQPAPRLPRPAWPHRARPSTPPPAWPADKFSFANGTGSSKKGKRRNSVGRAISPRTRRR